MFKLLNGVSTDLGVGHSPRFASRGSTADRAAGGTVERQIARPRLTATIQYVPVVLCGCDRENPRIEGSGAGRNDWAPLPVSFEGLLVGTGSNVGNRT